MTGTVTYMCENGYHGSAHRRSAFRTDEHGVTHLRFTDMYSGNCAGTVFHLNGLDDPYETDCLCACHEFESRETFADAARGLAQTRADALAAFDAEYGI